MNVIGPAPHGLVPRHQEAILAAAVNLNGATPDWVGRLCGPRNSAMRTTRAADDLQNMWSDHGWLVAGLGMDLPDDQRLHAGLRITSTGAVDGDGHPRPEIPDVWIELSQAERRWANGGYYHAPAAYYEVTGSFVALVQDLLAESPAASAEIMRWEDAMVVPDAQWRFISLASLHGAGDEVRPDPRNVALPSGQTLVRHSLARRDMETESVDGRRLGKPVWFRSHLPRPFWSAGPKSNGDLVIVAGVDADLATDRNGRSLTQRFLECEWGDIGAVTISEVRRAIAEYLGAYLDSGPMVRPLAGEPLAAFNGLEAFATRDGAHVVIGARVLLHSYEAGDVQPHEIDAVSGDAEQLLKTVDRQLAELGVKTRASLHFVVTGPGVA